MIILTPRNNKDYYDYLNGIYGISNPILNETPITSLITPNEIYLNLCAYLSSLNEVDFTDSRTYDQKAESAGFDSKTSFRNIK